jgi:hypothetical protein
MRVIGLLLFAFTPFQQKGFSYERFPADFVATRWQDS